MRHLGWLALLVVVGCKPYDVPEFEEIGTSSTAFLVPLEGNTGKQKAFSSEQFLSDHKVAVKRVQIPHRWVQKGRLWWSGEWIDTVRLITVDRAPVTREWTADEGSGTSEKDEAIWVESSDSVGFSTGISCTARIPDEDAAIKFLFNYPGGSLSDVMDTEIRARIQKVIANRAAQAQMDLLREMKVEILESVEADVIPFFAKRGIEITTIGQFGGFHYENRKIQDSIDAVFQSQQDEEVAKAETKAQLERNKAIELAAQGKAVAVEREAQGKANAIKLVADAKGYEMEKAAENQGMYLNLKQIELEDKRLEKWDGRYPQYLLNVGDEGLSPNLMLNIPSDK